MPFHIVLVEPEIAANTGNIARTCACTGMTLHLVHPLGFATDDRTLRRAGMDYWHLLPVYYHNSFDELMAAHPGVRPIFVATQGRRLYTEVQYRPGDWLVFGKESHGLPDFILENYPGTIVRIPMRPGLRSLNLATAVGIVAYEALRQIGFPGLG
ncbi:MAG: tRNA (cytidine(34)-2'-O)-methyltransferase [Limnochordales bacterium]|nr:tRNA (uridine(34)/cytosine(34)/5-carboxymethylaminomethyluridine(34)-2'-O)-methyltransferase TrmL [Bacillota bacterium]REJ34042.1 MAG: tRNA (uridine(34)/cytosine(34)/5-carboxymethylaminomethyluridine(34)-2'-O)-methyltransferase TrmL [Bacillota bacterium]